jgi:lipid-binding SYLF domain-containing protein
LRISVVPAFLAVAIAAAAAPSGCSTAPKADNQASFISESKAAKQWFEGHVVGLDKQIAASAGYIVYPSVGQWGIIFMGGQFGRGTVNEPNGTQIGWGAVNIASIGLQAGVRGFKMLVIIQDKATLDKFKGNQLQGSVTGVAVAAETGASGTAPFTNGVVVYQGASAGLMAGVNIGLDYLRFKPLGDEK